MYAAQNPQPEQHVLGNWQIRYRRKHQQTNRKSQKEAADLGNKGGVAVPTSLTLRNIL